MTTENINIFLVDDHQVLLDGLSLLIGGVPDIKIIGTARDGQDLLEQLKAKKKVAERVDVILMDINMPVMNGLEATQQVKGQYPNTKVIMLTMRDQMPDLNHAVAKGADGFLSKNTGRTEIIDTIRKVFKQGEFIVHTDLEKPRFSLPLSKSSNEAFITEREKQIICLITQEYSIQSIATLLSLSTMTVQTQRKNIMSKLRVRSDVGIVREATKRNLCKNVVLPSTL